MKLETFLKLEKLRNQEKFQSSKVYQSKEQRVNMVRGQKNHQRNQPVCRTG